METLFKIDLRDYSEEDEKNVFKRPSARAIVIRDGKVLLIHSGKYHYYKFPGGGIKEGESCEEALIREVKEETGCTVIPESIQEYGYVLRKQKDPKQEHGIFLQDNYYYFCEIADEITETAFEDNEKEEQFTTEWMEPFVASHYNRYESLKGCDKALVKREAKVLDLIEVIVTKKVHEEEEKRAIEALGDLDYAEMFAYVKNELGECCESGPAKVEINYSRFEHTKRVVGWAKRLYEVSDCKDELNYEDIIISAIFHDVGRRISNETDRPHAWEGVPYTREYLLSHGFEKERTEYICSLVERHSDKWMMWDENVDSMDKNLLLLMEADFMDDMGALGVVMDCMIVEARNNHATFMDCYDHIARYTQRILKQSNPMVTKAAREMWEEKTRLVDSFMKSLKQDIEL